MKEINSQPPVMLRGRVSDLLILTDPIYQTGLFRRVTPKI